MTSNNANGELACVVLNEKSQSEYETNDAYKPSAQQVYLGVDVNNQNAVGSKRAPASVSGTAATSLTIDGLSAGTKYSAFCTASNGYPVWPSFVVQSNWTPVNFTTDGTADTDDDDDSFALLASSNVVAICTMIAALIFN